jgi:hypothetical protein
MIVFWKMNRPILNPPKFYEGFYLNSLHNETRTVMSETPAEILSGNSFFFVKFASMVQFNATVPNIESMNYIFFACHESIKPIDLNNGTWHLSSLGKHTTVNFRDLRKGPNQCDLLPPNPLLFVNMSPYTLVLLSFYYIVLIILCIALRENQPLKSRGILPVLFLLFGYGFNMSTFPAYVFDDEWIATKSCFVTASMTFPIISTLISLLFIVKILCLNFRII